MKKHFPIQGLSLCLCILFFHFSLHAQPQIEWERSFGGNNEDVANAVILTTDGGCIAVGFTYSNNGDISTPKGDRDLWVVKLDITGDLEWEKTYGGSNSDFATDIQPAIGGGYFISGGTESTDGDVSPPYFEGQDLWLIKVNNLGELLWEKSYGGNNTDEALSITSTADGGATVAGQTTSTDGDIGNPFGLSDLWVVKVDNNGLIQWENCYGGSSYDFAQSIEQTTDGGYIISGNSSSVDINLNNNYGYTDFWVMKLDAGGLVEWTNSFGGSVNDNAYQVKETNDGGYLAVGFSASGDNDVASNYGGFDGWVLKMDVNGTLEWEQNYGGSGAEVFYNFQQDADNGYTLVGYSSSSDNDVQNNMGDRDFWMLKINSTGDLLWEKTFGGSNNDRAYDFQQSNDGSFFLAGQSDSNNGDASYNQGNADFWVIKTEATLVATNEQDKEQISISIYPNPTTAKLNIVNNSLTEIEINIFTSQGKEVYNNKSSHELTTLDLQNISTGVYFISVVSEEQTITRKIVKE